MDLITQLKKNHDEMSLWRQHLHQYPETAYEESATSEFIAEKLRDFGLDVHQGLAETGVVASLTTGTGEKKIALRADIDALNIREQNQFSYRSRNEGKMHACGHDGHSSMLLGAAKYLTATKNFNGTVHFIFQPAEEGGAGAKRMIEEGLFDLFPADSIYGMHNFPDVPQGHFAVKAGAMMASFDGFEIRIHGHGTHAAMPHLGNDPIVIAAQIINALQTIVSRNTNPADSAVVSITQVHAGETWNAIPDSVTLRGTFRCFKSDVRKDIQEKIKDLVCSLSRAMGAEAMVEFNPESSGYPVTINTDQETAVAAGVAAEVVGINKVDLDPVPSMGAEDFAFMLKEKPGCYIWIGNGASQGSCLLHNPNYDFNDEILPVGAAYWVKLVETVLPK